MGMTWLDKTVESYWKMMKIWSDNPDCLGFIQIKKRGRPDGWSIKDPEDNPDKWFKPVSNIQSGGHHFVQYHPDILFPDGIYNGRYNKEAAIIRIRGGRPVYVSFIGSLNSDGESVGHCIYNEKGILASSVEILLKSQVISESNFITL